MVNNRISYQSMNMVTKMSKIMLNFKIVTTNSIYSNSWKLKDKYRREIESLLMIRSSRISKLMLQVIAISIHKINRMQ